MTHRPEDPAQPRFAHRGRVIRAEIRIARPAHEVFEAWADPERIAAWFVDRAEGRGETGAVVTWIFEHFGYRMPVPILLAQPGKVFVTGTPPGDDAAGLPDSPAVPEGTRPPALLEVRLEQEGGSTLLRLANSGFLDGDTWDDEYEGVASGWRLALAQLRHWLERHAPSPRVHRLAMRPAPFRFPEHVALLDTRAGLQRWWERVEAPLRLEPGACVKLGLAPGVTLEGEVLAHSGREVLLSWPERASTLALKAFRAGPSVMICLDASTWSSAAADDPAPLLPPLLERLERAVAL